MRPAAVPARTRQLSSSTNNSSSALLTSWRRVRSSSSITRSSTTRASSSTSTSTTTAVTDTRTATVQVDLGHAAEQAVVRLTHPHSRLVESTIQFPLGLVLENVDGEVVITEVSEGSAAAAANCCVGDVVRATTAYTMQMTYPTMNLMFGGGGRPKLMKLLVPTDKVAFSRVMDAVRSNTADQGGDGTVTLVLERIGASADGGSGANGDDSSGNTGSSSSSSRLDAGALSGTAGAAAVGGAAAERGAEGDGPVFDPRIFNSHFD